MLFLAALVGVGFAGSSNQIATGVAIAGVNVGGLTPTQARHKLEQAAARVAWVPVEFQAADKRFKIAPAQLGVRADWDTAIDNARHNGDGFGPLRGFKRLEMRFVGVDLEPPFSHSQPALERFLAQVARSVDKPVREPALVLDGDQPTIVAGRNGRALKRRRPRAWSSTPSDRSLARRLRCPSSRSGRG
jgi:hypothetical protein